MAKDLVTIKNESLRSNEDHNRLEISFNDVDENLHTPRPKDMVLDFQKKITLSKHEKKDGDVNSLLGHKESYKQLAGMYKLCMLKFSHCSFPILSL